MNQFSYEIIKPIETINAGEKITLEVNLISFNGAAPKVDIRRWDRSKDKMLKGISLTFEEAAALKNSLDKLENLKIEN